MAYNCRAKLEYAYPSRERDREREERREECRDLDLDLERDPLLDLLLPCGECLRGIRTLVSSRHGLEA